MILLSQVIKAWDDLHRVDTGHLGFSDLVAALETAGITIYNDCLAQPTAPGFAEAVAAPA